ncbi:MAG TPA: hypothetical protein VF602_02650 [Pedobacter sp.]|jgi:hypothetical protein
MGDYYTHENQIKDLILQFSDHTLPAEKWTHQAHLTVAFWHLFHFSIEEATCYLRSGIKSYNHSNGTKNTPSGGYHESITLFWIKVIYDYQSKYSSKSLLECCNAFLESEFADKNYIFSFYSKDILFTSRARAFWVEPNLQALKISV